VVGLETPGAQTSSGDDAAAAIGGALTSSQVSTGSIATHSSQSHLRAEPAEGSCLYRRFIASCSWFLLRRLKLAYQLLVLLNWMLVLLPIRWLLCLRCCLVAVCVNLDVLKSSVSCSISNCTFMLIDCAFLLIFCIMCVFLSQRTRTHPCL
jgi:hypothetical protein